MITDRLVEFAEVQPTPDALEIMRLSLFDWAACAIAGAAEAEFAAFRAQIIAEGGAARSSVIAGGRVPPAQAALVNGTLSHALDYDDTHFGHIGHPSVAVVPAVLALAEAQRRPLEEAVAAALIGVEASIHVGLWLGRDHYQVGFHQTATAGAFGATLGAARVLGLTPGQRRHALGLCASLASGLKAQFGTMGKPLNAGLAARSGVEAALWAQGGMTAAADGLAGPQGFGPTHHGQAEGAALARIGQGAWQIETISHKFHACCHGLHAMLEALAETDVAAKDVARVDIRTHPRWMTVCNIAEPATGLETKFSYAQTAAMALTGRNTGAIDSYTDALAHDPELVVLRGRVAVTADERLSEMQAEVRVLTSDGSAIEVRHDLAAPLGVNLRAQKLKAKAAGLLGSPRAEALWQATQGDSFAALSDQIATPL